MENVFKIVVCLYAVILTADVIVPSNAENTEQTSSNIRNAEIINAVPADDGTPIPPLSNPENDNFLQEPINAQARHHPHHIDETTNFEQPTSSHFLYAANPQYPSTPTSDSTFSSNSQLHDYQQNIQPEFFQKAQPNVPIVYRTGIYFTVFLNAKYIRQI